jgi:hypothetical protein
VTEEEWLRCTNPSTMLKFLRGKASDRRMRLLVATAADRDSPDTLTYATASVGVSNPPTVPSVSSAVDIAATAVACAAAEQAPASEYDKTHAKARRQEVNEQVRLVLDIFGNPFRPVTANAHWLTSTVVTLAEGIYQEKAFDRLPILADALQDAGCSNEDVLNHCLQPGRPTRGCWVIDPLTGRR